MEVPNIVSFTLAIVLLFVGKVVLERSALLRQYSLPEAVVGGFLAAIVVSVLYFGADIEGYVRARRAAVSAALFLRRASGSSPTSATSLRAGGRWR